MTLCALTKLSKRTPSAVERLSILRNFSPIRRFFPPAALLEP
jgi:hypothetical protein